MNNKLKPALLGGLVVGLLSGVLSIVPIANYCCCLWSLAGGALAAFIYIKGSPVPVKIGDGAMVGALAGVFGGIIYLIINLPLTLLIGMAALAGRLRETGVNLPVSTTVLVILSSFVTAVILAGLATVGGILGVAIFEKRKDAIPPPAPQNFA
jgi:hypothetical protein